MKSYIILLFLSFCFSQGLSSQEVSNSQVKLAVRMPSVYLEDIKPIHVTKIHTKIQTMLSGYDISSIDYINDFLMYPTYEIYNHSELQSPLGKIHSIEAILTLKVIDVNTKTLFGVYTIELKGEDQGSKDRAITKSISRIKTRDVEIEQFLSTVKRKIINYYQSNCDQIYNDASVLLANGAVKDAIRLLLTVPRGLTGSCYNKIQEKISEAYLVLVNAKCQNVINKAKQAIANNDKAYAQEQLKLINSSSPCFSAAQELLTELNVLEQKTSTQADKNVKKRIKKEVVKELEKVNEEESRKKEDEILCENFGVNCN